MDAYRLLFRHVLLPGVGFLAAGWMVGCQLQADELQGADPQPFRANLRQWATVRKTMSPAQAAEHWFQLFDQTKPLGAGIQPCRSILLNLPPADCWPALRDAVEKRRVPFDAAQKSPVAAARILVLRILMAQLLKEDEKSLVAELHKLAEVGDWPKPPADSNVFFDSQSENSLRQMLRSFCQPVSPADNSEEPDDEEAAGDGSDVVRLLLARDPSAARVLLEDEPDLVMGLSGRSTAECRRAADGLETISRLHPESPWLIRQVVELNSLMGREQRALEFLQNQADRSARSPRHSVARALALFCAGEEERAAGVLISTLNDTNVDEQSELEALRLLNTGANLLDHPEWLTVVSQSLRNSSHPQPGLVVQVVDGLVNRGRYREAERLLQDAISRTKPELAVGLMVSLSRVFHAAGRSAEVEQLLEGYPFWSVVSAGELLKSRPSMLDPVAGVLRGTDSEEQLLDVAEQLIVEDSRYNARAWHMLTERSPVRLEQTAVRQIRWSGRIAPHLWLARRRMQQGRYQDAQHLLEQALRVTDSLHEPYREPGELTVQVWEALAEVHTHFRRDRRSEAARKAAVGFRQYLHARRLAQFGLHGRAVESLEQAVTKFPDHPALWLDLGLLQAYRATDSANRSFRRGLRAGLERPEWLPLAMDCSHQFVQVARPVVDQAIEDRPDDPRGYLVAAWLAELLRTPQWDSDGVGGEQVGHRAAGGGEQRRVFFRAALDREPENLQALTGLVHLLREPAMGAGRLVSTNDMAWLRLHRLRPALFWQMQPELSDAARQVVLFQQDWGWVDPGRHVPELIRLTRSAPAIELQRQQDDRSPHPPWLRGGLPCHSVITNAALVLDATCVYDDSFFGAGAGGGFE